jgi:hypothetical protein
MARDPVMGAPQPGEHVLFPKIGFILKKKVPAGVEKSMLCVRSANCTKVQVYVFFSEKRGEQRKLRCEEVRKIADNPVCKRRVS